MCAVVASICAVRNMAVDLPVAVSANFDVYGHLLPGSHDEVRRRMDAYLRGDDAQGVGGA